MNITQKLSSKNLFIFNLVLIGAIFGFTMAFFSFSCSSGTRVQAQESTVIIPASSLAVAENLQTVFRSITDKTLPSVVELKTVSVRRQQVPNFNGIPWEFFFGPRDRGGQDGQEREFRSAGLGSGLIVRHKDGIYYALTNNHVVDNATEIRIATKEGKEYPAELVGKDERKDLALVSFKTNDHYPLAVLGDSDTVAVGDWAIAMGNPLGEQFSFSVTMGIVSAVGRTGGPGGNINDFIQTDAPINQGNSGGPLVNIRGEVIGINTWIASNLSGGGNVGLGFAIPINNAKRSIDEFIETGTTSYGWLGVSLIDPNRDTVTELGLEGKRGALASQVFIGSPADNGGLKAGDFITHVNNREVRGVNQLQMIVGDLKPGDRATFTVIRDKQNRDFPVRIEARTDQIASDNKKLWPGVSLIPLTDQIRQNLNIDENVKGLFVYQLVAGSPSDIIGIKQGDLITSINGENVSDMAVFYKVLREKTASELWFGIRRGESTLESLRFKK
ncbi:MAG: Do family serine endopeptidase [Treponema sp.]|nr:Do family serine endopeptidase [Treponema sp.]MCL2271408.1 Do family serine endopeptidase [Treponema sp.]